MTEEKQDNQNPGPGEVAISVEPDVEKGAYCNLASIHHSAAEFVFDFIFVLGNRGQVVSRVITSPQHAKALLAALDENIKKYEASHGPISPAQAPAQNPVIAH